MKIVTMQPYWPYDGRFINWKQCVTVIWICVSIETESKEIDSLHSNRTDGMVDEPPSSYAILTFMNCVMPICPPPNNIHLLCDVITWGRHVTCAERAIVIRHCLELYEGIYVNSDWTVCESVNNFCKDTVYLLNVKGYLATSGLQTLRTSDRPILTTENSAVKITSTIISAFPGEHTHISIVTDTTESTSTPYHTEVTVATTNPIITMATNTSSSDTSGQPSQTGDMGVYWEPTYVYALIGVIVVLIEIAILVFLYFYLRKREQTQPYRHPSKESLHEEMICPETTSPTQALVIPNMVFDDEDIFKQDQKIYQSYLNLRFIDDTSAEATPERTIMK